MEHVFRKEVIKAVMTLNNFFLQDEKYTPDVFMTLQKVRDEIQVNINFGKKQRRSYSYFDKV